MTQLYVHHSCMCLREFNGDCVASKNVIVSEFLKTHCNCNPDGIWPAPMGHLAVTDFRWRNFSLIKWIKWVGTKTT